MKFKTITLISFIFILSSCSFFESSNSKKLASKNKELTNLNKKYKGKKIDLITNLLNKVFKSKKDGDLSMLIYYDANCSVCFMKLKKWESNIEYFKRLNDDLNIKFILYSEDSLVTDINLKESNIPKSLVVYDNNNSYLRKYEHSIEYAYNTMLLNKDNEIIFIGSPQVSNNLKMHYTKLIKE